MSSPTSNPEPSLADRVSQLERQAQSQAEHSKQMESTLVRVVKVVDTLREEMEASAKTTHRQMTAVIDSMNTLQQQMVDAQTESNRRQELTESALREIRDLLRGILL